MDMLGIKSMLDTAYENQVVGISTVPEFVQSRLVKLWHSLPSM
jgi:hypothetical protein